MSLDAIANTDLAYDTEVFRACAKTYGQIAEDLRITVDDPTECLKMLVDSGWTTPAGITFSLWKIFSNLLISPYVLVFKCSMWSSQFYVYFIFVQTVDMAGSGMVLCVVVTGSITVLCAGILRYF